VNDYDRFFDRKGLAFGEQPTAELSHHVCTAKTGPVLDMGCGDGRNTLFLAAAGCRVTATDRSEVALVKLARTARDRMLGNRVTVAATDVRDWAFGPGRFGMIVAVTIFDHLALSEVDPVIARMVGSLRPGGKAFVQVHTVEDPGFRRRNGVPSETAWAVEHYFEFGELRGRLSEYCRIESYEERVEYDTGHGRPHHHGFAVAVGRK
jgi:cyclopropane fatty-acyl-phospholipid synthase-like methyltransferase